MPSSLEKRKRQRRLILIFIGAVFIGAVILYFGFLREPKPSVPEEFLSRIDRSLREVKLNTDILQDRRFIELTPYSRISTDIQTGRLNPFSPYRILSLPPPPLEEPLEGGGEE